MFILIDSINKNIAILKAWEVPGLLGAVLAGALSFCGRSAELVFPRLSFFFVKKKLSRGKKLPRNFGKLQNYQEKLQVPG